MYNQYEIVVYTRHEEHGGTNADVFVNLIGEYGSSGFFEIDNADDNFEQGHTDHFVVSQPKVLGNISAIQVRLTFKGNDPKWKPGWFAVGHNYEYTRANGGGVIGGTSWSFDCFGAYITDNHQIYTFKETSGWHSDETEAAQIINGGSSTSPNIPPPPPPPAPPKIGSELVFVDSIIEPSLFPEAGSPFTIRVLAANLGDTAAASIPVAFQLFESNNPQLLADHHTEVSLFPGGNAWTDWTIEGGLPAGHYIAIAVIDPANQYKEPVETNNVASIGFQVDPPFGSASVEGSPVELPNDLQIAWVLREPAGGGAITRIGGRYLTLPWSVTVHEALEELDLGRHNYTSRDSDGHSVQIAPSGDPGRRHVATLPDAWISNNLTRLPTPKVYYADVTPGPLMRDYTH